MRIFQFFHVAAELNVFAVGWRDGQLVPVIQQLKYRLQVVVAVIPLPGDMEEEIEFGRGLVMLWIPPANPQGSTQLLIRKVRR